MVIMVRSIKQGWGEDKSFFKLLKRYFFWMLMFNDSKVISSYSSTNVCKYGASSVWMLSQPGLPREGRHNMYTTTPLLKWLK